jgi:hypothetical protein
LGGTGVCGEGDWVCEEVEIKMLSWKWPECTSIIPTYEEHIMAKSKPTPSLKDHKKQGQLPIHTNRIYFGKGNLNIYLTYDQAVQVATNILKKAELIKQREDLAVQLWAKEGSDKLNFGINDVVQKGTQEAWD